MPIIIIIAFIVALCSKPKKRKVAVYKFPDYAKIQRERERQAEQQKKQIEQENRRFEREQEKQLKQLEQAKKKAQAKQDAIDKINWLDLMLAKYSDLYEKIEAELANNPSLTVTKQIQLEKQLLQIEEKQRRFREQMDKAYFTAYKS